MDCARLQEKLPAFVDGRLGRLTAWRFSRHLRRCPRCRTDLDAVRKIVEGVRELPAPHRSDRFWENFHKRVMASLPPEPHPRPRWRPNPRLVPALAAAAAALAAVIVLRWPTGTDGWAPQDWTSEELLAVAPWEDLSKDDLRVVLEEMEDDQTWPSNGSAAAVAVENATPWEALDLLNADELSDLLNELERETGTANA